jgi:lipopolysaccharide transport system permease protein
LTRREIAERYVGQALGTAWAIGHPLIAIGVYIFVFAYVFGMRMGESSETSLDYTTYLLSGLIPWLTFADVLNRSCNSVTSNASLVKQILFPVEILPIKTVTAALVNQLVATGGSSGLHLGGPRVHAAADHHLAGNFRDRGDRIDRPRLCAVLSNLTVYFRDLKDIILVFTGIGMYISPILFSKASIPRAFYIVMFLNAFSYIAWVYQDAIFYGRILHPWAWLIFTILNLAFLSLGFRLFRVLRPSFGDVL